MKSLVKLCTKCKKELPLSKFHKNKKGEYGLHWNCKECRKIEYQENGEHNRKKRREYYQKNKNKIRKKAREKYRDNFIYEWSRATIRTHRHKGYKINLDKDKLMEIAEITQNCPICSCKLDWGYKEGKFPDNSPTLDRFNNNEELNEYNVWIICRKCNSTKQNRNMSEFTQYCENIYNRFKGI